MSRISSRLQKESIVLGLDGSELGARSREVANGMAGKVTFVDCMFFCCPLK